MKTQQPDYLNKATRLSDLDPWLSVPVSRLVWLYLE